MDKVEHIFFDLDHTLWDFDTNSKQTLAELYESFSLEEKGIAQCDHFINQYLLHNDRFWALYRENRISKGRLRNSRFEATLRDFGINDKAFAKRIGAAYVELCPQKTVLHEGALDVLDRLKKSYILHIISNGFQEVQMIKLEVSGLLPFFNEIITSEKANAKKPSNRIFHFAERKTNSEPAQSLMIGDNYEIDVLGAIGAGWHAIHFSPNQESLHDHSIDSLTQIENYLV